LAASKQPGDRSDQENTDIVSSDTANPQQPDPEDAATAKLSKKGEEIEIKTNKTRLSPPPLSLQFHSSTTADSMATVPVHHKKMNCGFLEVDGEFYIRTL
jgi:hypothetical protein